ncbi:MAG: alpha/beta hydrolase [Arsukibacterium sp.]|nr:alpha/beta hydrolase [Arsukibacterium sp.]
MSNKEDVMDNPVIILHGWSDNSRSFAAISKFIKQLPNKKTVHLHLGDWLSMHDDVTYTDLATAMQRAWHEMGLPTGDRTVDLVVHSTGSLVARQWLTQFYTASHNPVKRFVMMAPANFGSHLAHKGRSFFGRAVKGWGQPGFQTGTQILKGLELASPYTQQLALNDLFANENWYGAGKILATVMIGNTGYSGISAIANEAGSDGTVRISGANLNCSRITVALDEQQCVLPGSLHFSRSKGDIALAILDNENHGTLVFKDKGPNNPLTRTVLEKALQVEDTDYQPLADSFNWQQQINALDPTVIGKSPQRSQVVCQLTDHLANNVQDYFVEFYRTGKKDEKFEQQLYQQFLCGVHAYSDNGANRALYFNLASLNELRQRYQLNQLYLSFNAEPHYKPPRQPVGYASVAASATAGIKLQPDDIDWLFTAHQTVLLQVVMQRSVDAAVFKLRR